MTIHIRPDLAKFVKEEIDAGRYSSADEAVNTAIERLQAERELLSQELDDQDLAAIEEGLAQLREGKGRPWAEVRAELQSKYGS